MSDIGNVSIATMMKRMSMLEAEYNYHEIKEQQGLENPAELKYELSVSEIGGIRNIELKVLDYAYKSIGETRIHKKYQKTLQNILITDSLQLIEYIAMDMDYDGCDFRPSIKHIRNKDSLEFTLTGPIGKTGKIAIRTYDAFGLTNFQVINLRN